MLLWDAKDSFFDPIVDGSARAIDISSQPEMQTLHMFKVANLQKIDSGPCLSFPWFVPPWCGKLHFNVQLNRSNQYILNRGHI